MSIKYKLTRVNDNITHNPVPRYNVTTVSYNNIRMKQLKERLCGMSAASPGDVSLVLDNLSDLLAEYLREGHTVTIDGIGTFSVTATLAEPLEDPSVVPSGAVRVKAIRFQASKELKEEVAKARFKRIE
ncbi:MAG: HU family DNA-binding protein [Tannerellaceae bacterium]|nr:HU family DNA-binding protein [Tannerellaceae bacterium]